MTHIFKELNVRYHSNKIGLVVLMSLFLLQTACVNSLRNEARPLPSIKTAKLETTSNVQPSQTSELNNVDPRPNQAIELQSGNGNYLGKERFHGTKALRSNEEGISLNFKNIDLQAFIQAILGDALNHNYLIDPAVTGTVTIQTVRPLPKDDLLGVLQEILSLNGATLMLNDGRYRVMPVNKAAQLPVVSRIKRLRNQGYGLQIVPLHYIGASEMAQIIQPSIQSQGVVYTDKRRNLLILSGSEPLLSSIMDLITLFDVDWLEGKSISLFPLRYVDPETLVAELESVLEGSAGELFDGMVRLIPIERVNGILVVSNTKEYMHTLSSWIKRLDISNDKAEKKLYVYHLQNTKAVDIASILTTIFSNTSNSSARTQPTAQVLPTDRPVTLNSSPNEITTRNNTQSSLSITNSGITLSDNTSVRIIADETSNTVVIMGTSREYEMVESAIRKLDILPKQVLIEATIIEVGLTGDLSYGVEWFFKNGGVGSNKTGNGKLSLGTDGIAAAAPGFSYSIIDGATDVRFVLNALESETNVQVLSSPSIMVLDNKSATINVGDEIPIPTRQSSSNTDSTAPTVNEIQYRNTGILLTVSPRINAGGLVTLEVKQEVSDAITTESSGLDAPTIQQRSIESTVAIQSGQSVILGGLIKNKREDSTSGVPILSRLPILGNLFRQQSNSDRRTELLVIITPHVIDNPAQAQAITEEFRNKLIQPVQLNH